jgi:small GTP-binding protein
MSEPSEHPSGSVFLKKVCIVGDFGVGKTSLIRRFVDFQFSDQYLSTVGVKISRKLLQLEKIADTIPEKSLLQSLQMMIWDIEGQTQFQAIVPSYLQGARGIIIVGDLSRPETIEHIQGHLSLVDSLELKKVSVMIALNKVDLAQPDTSPQQQLIANFQAHSEVVGVYTTSAKTGSNVETIFHELAQKII